MNIFITGATGFLGQQVLDELRRRNHRLTALVRSPEKAALPNEVEMVKGTIENLESYRSRLQGQDIFVHIAALVKMWVRDARVFDQINVEAVKQAIQAATDSGIQKFVHTSSFMALGPSDGPPIIEEDSRRTDHFHNDYERTKFLGDQVARKYQQDGYPVTILYPGVIYGSGSLTDGNIIAKNIIPLLNRTMPFGMNIQTWSYAFVPDIVKAFIKIIEEQTPSNRYILGGDNQPGPQFYQALQEASGTRPPLMNIPISVAKMAGYSEYLMAQLFGREPKMLTHQVAEIYKHSWAYDSTRAKRELGYTITPLKDGLTDLVRWLRKSGHVR